VPGPCAAIAALAISGLPTDRFVFEGFLPSQAKARSTRLAALAGETRTMVFYEAPHRIADTVAALVEGFGSGREAVIGRELTKRFESVYSGTLDTLLDRFGRDPDANRGEFVVMVAGAPELTSDAAELDRLLRVVLRETDRKSAVRIVTALSGCSRNQVYQASLAVNARSGDGGEDLDAGD
jgi:16S rRNA (cytidine1402-2'-O)-methyltransferase